MQLNKLNWQVITGKANEWVASMQHAQTFGPLAHNKRVAFSVFSGGFIHEPQISYATWAEAYRQNIDNN